MTELSRSSTPLISIIIAVRNAEKTLARTLLSAAGQDYEKKEIILIDGASTDDSLQVARKFRDRLSVLISEPDGGIADAYNKGIRNARGDWLYFLNADDVFSSDSTLTRIFAGRNLSRYDLVLGKVLADNGAVFHGRYGWTLLMRNNVHHQAIFYHGDLIRKLQYNTQYKRYGHDHEHNLVLWRKGVKVLYLDEIVAHWSSGGISNNANWTDYKQEFLVRRNVLGRTAWLWNVFTVGRFLLKTGRVALRRKAGRFRLRSAKT